MSPDELGSLVMNLPGVGRSQRHHDCERWDGESDNIAEPVSEA